MILSVFFITILCTFISWRELGRSTYRIKIYMYMFVCVHTLTGKRKIFWFGLVFFFPLDLLSQDCCFLFRVMLIFVLNLLKH